MIKYYIFVLVKRIIRDGLNKSAKPIITNASGARLDGWHLRLQVRSIIALYFQSMFSFLINNEIIACYYSL